MGTLIEAVMLTKGIKDRSWEYDVIEDIDANSDISNLVYENLDAEGKRLSKIADYLRERQDRKWRQK